MSDPATERNSLLITTSPESSRFCNVRGSTPAGCQLTPNQITANGAVGEHIAKYGWHGLSVHPDSEDQQPFTYSIEFFESLGQPEFVIFNQPRDKAHSLLGECAGFLRRGEAIELNREDGRVLASDFMVIIKLVVATEYDEYLGTARRYCKERVFPAVVMFVQDKNHRYPWDADYNYVDVRGALGSVA